MKLALPTPPAVRPFRAGLLALVIAPVSLAQIRVPDDFPTIQAAVAASAAGGTILIRAGSYAEQVVINGKNLTLIGQPGAVVVPPPFQMQETGQPYGPYRPLVTAILSDVTIAGLTFDGQQSATANPQLTGVLYLGSSGSVRDCRITGCRNAELFGGSGFVATNPDELGTGVVSLCVHDNVFDNNGVQSIDVFGDIFPTPTFPGVLRIVASVLRNTVRGVGLTTEAFQIGILINADAGGIVAGNTVTDHINQHPNPFDSSGIVIGLPYVPGLINGSAAQHVIVANNTLRNNREGIVVLASDGMLIAGNTVVGPGRTFAGADGILVSGRGNLVTTNKVSAVDFGIVMLGTETLGGLLGFAVDTWVIGNRIADTVTPIVDQTGVTGTVLRGNRITP